MGTDVEALAVMREWFRMKQLGDDHAQIDICGDIGMMHTDDEAQTSQHFIAALDSLPRSVRRLDLNLNSDGGRGDEAVLMARALRRHRVMHGRQIRVSIQTPCSSAATVIMCAANVVQIERRAALCIHNPFWTTEQQQPDDLGPLAQEMIRVYRWLVPMSAERLAALMSAVTFFDAQEAVANGFAHRVYEGQVDLPFWSASGLLERGVIPAAARVQIPSQFREAGPS